MLKIFFLILLIGTIGGGIYLAVLALSESEGNTTGTYTDLDVQQNNSTTPVDEENISTQDGRIILSSASGDTVILADSINDTEAEVLTEGFSLLFDEQAGREVTAYDIFYDRPSASITIYLHELPLSVSRQVAVDVLIDKFAISVEQLCGFNISIQTNQFVSPEYTGMELGLPGCPNAVSLP